MVHTILWRRLDRPGHESAAISRSGSEWRLDGAAVFSQDRQACRLDYRIRCDAAWRTLSAEVSGWLGEKPVAISIAADAQGRWTRDGREAPEVAGCIDVDLNFSPSTNLLPIRRLHLSVGGEAPVRAAWLRFPTFALEPLEQTYRRTGERTYRYASAGGRFAADLRVDPQGFPIDYAGVWRAEAGHRDATAPAPGEERPKIRATTPYLVVSDLDRSMDFYGRTLGFGGLGTWGEPPGFAIVRRDDFDLMLSLAGKPELVRPNGPLGLWDVYVTVEDVAREDAALRKAGIAVERGPEKTEYGMLEIEVLDPDGYRICLGQHVD